MQGYSIHSLEYSVHNTSLMNTLLREYNVHNARSLNTLLREYSVHNARLLYTQHREHLNKSGKKSSALDFE